MNPRHFELPATESIDPDQIVVRYHEPSDTLMLHLLGLGLPGVSSQISEHIFVRYDPDTSLVIGLQIEGFLSGALDVHPELLALAELADIPSDVMQRWRRREQASQASARLVGEIMHDLLPATA